MILNIVNGKPKVATINVTSLSGATVTCSQSPYSFTATANASGVASFVVPKSGTWSITATKSGETKTGSANVTTYNQTVNVTLIFRAYLYNNGTQTIPWSAIGGYSDLETSDMRLQQLGLLETTNTVDLTQYSTLYFKCKSISSTANVIVGCGTTKIYNNYDSLTHESTISSISGTTAVYSMNISSITGNNYIAFRKPSTTSSTGIYIYEVYVE